MLRQNHVVTLMVFLLLVLGAACGPSEPMVQREPNPLSVEDVTGVEALSEAFHSAYVAQDWEALKALYTEDAVVLPPNAPEVVGRDNIQQYFASGLPGTTIEIETVEIDGFADLAYIRGTFVSTTSAAEEGESVIATGKFLEIRRKQADGSWLISRDMFNSSDPILVEESE